MTDAITEHRFQLRERDGIALAARRWSADAPARAVMVAAHGMGEHSARYRAPLTPLIENGIVTYALDHRGHGESIGSGGTPGDYGPGGFPGVVSDLAALVKQAGSEHPGLPVVLLGHSMGSFASQLFVLDHADLIDGLALSGSAALDKIAEAPLGDDVLAALNMPFEPARTAFDWISRDEGEVDTYIADPLCGFGLTPESFGSLFASAMCMADPAALGAIPKDLPIYIFSGLSDPLALALHALQPLIDRYGAAGLDVTADLYPDARHEILNETNRAEVVHNLSAWLDRVQRRAR